MSSISGPRKKDLTSKFEKIFIPDSSAGLARSHKVIRIEREKEVQFMKLCCQIRLDDSKKIRSENQREERKLKRVKKYYTQTSDGLTND
jgi:hypothetical protein